MLRILPPTTVIVTTTTDLDALGSASGSATYLVNVTDIGVGDTWTFTLRGHIDTAGRSIIVGTSAGITAVGLYRCALSADFNFAKAAVMRPLRVVATNTVAGAGPTITYEVYAICGD